MSDFLNKQNYAESCSRLLAEVERLREQSAVFAQRVQAELLEADWDRQTVVNDPQAALQRLQSLSAGLNILIPEKPSDRLEQQLLDFRQALHIETGFVKVEIEMQTRQREEAEARQKRAAEYQARQEKERAQQEALARGEVSVS